MKVNAILCPSCQHYIYSVTNHDYHYCKCGLVSVDGGIGEYMRFGWDTTLSPQDIIRVVLDIPQTRTELYNDWNHSVKNPRKFGTITKVRGDKFLSNGVPSESI